MCELVYCGVEPNKKNGGYFNVSTHDKVAKTNILIDVFQSRKKPKSSSEVQLF